MGGVDVRELSVSDLAPLFEDALAREDFAGAEFFLRAMIAARQ